MTEEGDGTTDEVAKITDPTTVRVLSALLLINALGSIVGNSTVIYTFVKEKPLGPPLRILLCNLAASNLIIAAIGEPMVVISGFHLGWVFGEVGRQSEAYIVTACGLTAMALLSFISVERYTRTDPNRIFVFTKTIAIRVCYVVWIFNFAYASFPFFGVGKWKAEGVGISNTLSWNTGKLVDLIYVMVMMVIGYFLPLIVILFCYNRILSLVRRALNLIHVEITEENPENLIIASDIAETIDVQTTKSHYETSTKDITDQSAVSNNRGNLGREGSDSAAQSHEMGESSRSNFSTNSQIELRIKDTERQTSNVIFMIIVSFFASWTPYTIVNLLVTFNKADLFAEGIRATAPAFLAKTSTFWSPVIYFAMNGEIRAANRRTVQAR